jgi:3-deoxy-D-manno-octulosonic-acid transferase
MNAEAAIFAYNLLLKTFLIAGSPVIVPLMLLSGKRRRTLLGRIAAAPLPQEIRCHEGRSVWVHALSVGEVLTAAPLIAALKRKYRTSPLFLSVTTLTGYQTAKSLLKSDADSIFFFPFDLPLAVKRISASVDPMLVVIVETDLWPNFLYYMKRKRIPVILANARISPRSYRRYRFLRFLSKPLFAAFTHICAQSIEDAERFLNLGVAAERVSVTGSLKFDRLPEGTAADEWRALRQRLAEAGRRIVLAGSTHEGEEAALISTLLRLKKHFPDLMLIIAPRNPDRARQISEDCRATGLSSERMCTWSRSAANAPDAVVVDSIGLLTALYAVADCAFVGGSLVPCGGHNPLEPAAHSKPVVFGPDMSDFSEVARMLIEGNGAIQVSNADELYSTLHRLLSDPSEAERMGSEAYRIFSRNRGAAEKTVDIAVSCSGGGDFL